MILEKLISVIAPYTCISCGYEGALVCAWCAPEMRTPLPSRCYRCKSLTQDFRVCKNCARHSALRHVWVSTTYEGLAKDITSSFKFERVQGAARVIAEQLAEILPYLSKETLIVPVPSATRRTRQRGYDHTALLGKELSKLTGLHYMQTLGRLDQTRQVGATRQQRLTQLQGSFYVKQPLLVKRSDVVLVDDIVTTGGTIEAAAVTLKAAGARSVSAVVFAQKT